MPRLFIAIALPPPVREALATLALPTGARRTRPSQHHLTLRFLGDVAAANLAPLQTHLSDVQAAAFTLAVSGVGVFPKVRQARVLWAGVQAEPHQALMHLHTAVRHATRQAGLPGDDRPYRPHITLARLRNPAPADVQTTLARYQDFAVPPFRVPSFHLYESILGDHGAVHHVRATYALA